MKTHGATVEDPGEHVPGHAFAARCLESGLHSTICKCVAQEMMTDGGVILVALTDLDAICHALHVMEHDR